MAVDRQRIYHKRARLRQLRAFCHTARHGSITQAAESLGLSQPAVSLHVRELENELDAVLFDRGGRGVALTSAGKRLCELAELPKRATRSWKLASGTWRASWHRRQHRKHRKARDPGSPRGRNTNIWSVHEDDGCATKPALCCQPPWIRAPAMLWIYNTLTRTKEAFRPIEPGHVRMYVCGMTVYDYSHLGHTRVLVAFDVVVRYLRSLGYRVTYVRNITDIDDKIIARANENGEDFNVLTRRFTEYMHEDCRALGVLEPDAEPRATHYIEPIVSMVERLIESGAAYRGANGDVYYDVSAFPAYGALSDRRLEDLRSGARVEIDEAKDDPLDFVLWKSSKPGEPSWESPWGPGRPGWHIECSAMSTACLGDHFDIHGGGMDLQFPHHENEIAQSEAATGSKFVNVWMHNGFVRIDDEKMSKSLGNFFTLRGVLEHYPAEAVRCFMLSSHYRSPLNYSEDQLRQADSAVRRLYTALRGLDGPSPAGGADEATADSRSPAARSRQLDGPPAAGPDEAWLARFRAAMDDDFNTPEAISVLFDLAHAIHRARESDPVRARALAGTLRALGAVLGLLDTDPDAWLRGESAGEGPVDDEIEAMIAKRAEARARKDWAEADRWRDTLTAAGIILEDGAQGTVWRRGRS